MTSACKIAANRRNAARSTGPRSAEGKMRARRNALKHGLATHACPDPAHAVEIERLAKALAGQAERSPSGMLGRGRQRRPRWTFDGHAIIAARCINMEIVAVNREKADRDIGAEDEPSQFTAMMRSLDLLKSAERYQRPCLLAAKPVTPRTVQRPRVA